MQVLVCCVIALVAAMWAPSGAKAAQTQNYPTKPVRIIVPYPPGEAADVIARLLSPVLRERMGPLLEPARLAAAT